MVHTLKRLATFTLIIFFTSIVFVRSGYGQKTYHVSVRGSDANEGTRTKPFRTISAAASQAQPGDIITVHEGVYRERIDPPRGGESETRRIVYQAAPGEKVVIKGSEIVQHWEKVGHDTWKATLPNSFFGKFNPFSDLIHGDWFRSNGRQHHTAAVYLNGEWLPEAAKMVDVLGPAGDKPCWFGQVDDKNTTIWAQFKSVNPNGQLVEVNVRQTVFYPEKTGINYITVRGFIMRDAATPWAPPTAEQIGLIGTHWSKGWVIENNVISHSRCSGIALGKYGDEGDNKAESAEGYVGTINRALKNGWNKDSIGHHLVRNNTISFCEQTGIVGSLGAVFSTITGNTIHDIHVQKLFTGDEMAGIKLHAAIDVMISRNHIYRCFRGIWLDWMAQGTRLDGNLFYDNEVQDLYCEVDHGPFLVVNNIFLSPTSLLTNSQGGAFVHNLIAGNIELLSFDSRMTPFLAAHSTEISGLHDNPIGDARYFNNLFMGQANLRDYDKATLPVWMAGNAYLKGAIPTVHDSAALMKPDFNPGLKLSKMKDGTYLDITLEKSWSTEQPHLLVTTELLGKAQIPDLPFENADGSPIRIDTDYFGKKRDNTRPFPGPFEILQSGKQRIRI